MVFTGSRGFGIPITVDFFHLLRRAEENGADKEPLLGKTAPAFELDLLGNEKLNPAEHRDKHIVILDFWAT